MRVSYLAPKEKTEKGKQQQQKQRQKQPQPQQQQQQQPATKSLFNFTPAFSPVSPTTTASETTGKGILQLSLFTLIL
jgi:hypothetical protein